MTCVAKRWLAALLAASCASGPTVEREILGRVQGVEVVPPERILAYRPGATAPRTGVDRIARLRVRWEKAEDRPKARRIFFEEASRFGADVILDYGEEAESPAGEAPLPHNTRDAEPWGPLIQGGGEHGALFLLGFVATIATLGLLAASRAPSERGLIVGCAARTRVEGEQALETRPR